MPHLIMYCLDSDVIIDFMRGDEGIAGKIRKMLGSSIHITTITLCELFKGAYGAKNPEHEVKRMETLTSSTITATLDVRSSRIFGIKSRELLLKGKTIGVPDIMIASICIANDLVLITRNKKHFEHITGLQADYW